jgi:hypothetical protein
MHYKKNNVFTINRCLKHDWLCRQIQMFFLSHKNLMLKLKRQANKEKKTQLANIQNFTSKIIKISTHCTKMNPFKI